MSDAPDAPDEPDESDHLDKLKAAVQEFACSVAGEAVLVDVAVLVWEQVGFDEDGTTTRRIQYTVPTDNFSLSSGLGLLEASREYIRRDILGLRCDRDD
jgi:hypothetical protein